MRWIPLVVVLVACGDPANQPDASTDTPMADASIDADPKNPPTLMDTGLCLDAACTQIAPGIKAYMPRFELWSDGATKKRWIYLPPGTQIDTSNMDYWQFPVGTKLWKEFTRDNVRVETRLVMRIGAGDSPQDWFYVAYVWNQAQDATTAETFGVVDANGTPHDVPTRSDCKYCHEATQPSRVIGFSAIQLDHDNANADEYDLAALVADNKLTNAPAASSAPYFPMSFTAEVPALGYLHTNCGHCHNPNSAVYMDQGIMMQLRLTVGTLGSLATTPPYTTAVDVTGKPLGSLTKIIAPGQPDNSLMIHRFESTNPAVHMPEQFIGAEIMDPTGRTTLRDWITNIP